MELGEEFCLSSCMPGDLFERGDFKLARCRVIVIEGEILVQLLANEPD